MSIASDIGNAYKKGDISKCIKAVNFPKARHDYCIATFSDDFAQLNFCRQTDDFCETCCQAEFGEMNASDKDNCLKKTCKKKTDADEEDESKPDQKPKENNHPIINNTPQILKKENEEHSRGISNSNGQGFIKQNAIEV